MRAGDRVVALHEPWRFGVGQAKTITASGRILVEYQLADGQLRIRLYDPQDLELEQRFMRAAA